MEFFTNATQVPVFRYLPRTPPDHAKELIELCHKGRLKEALKKFRDCLYSDPSLFSHFLKRCIPSKSISLGKQLHALILTFGCSSNVFISNHLLNMYSKSGSLRTILALFQAMPMRNTMTCNILIDGCVKNRDLKTARRVFDEMTHRNVATWNAMVAGLIQYEYNDEGFRLFSEMHSSNFAPDQITLATILGGYSYAKCLALGRQIHSLVTKSGFESDSIVGSALAHLYIRCGRLDQGEAVINSISIPGISTHNTLISGKAQNGYPEEALEHYCRSRIAGFKPNDITFVSAISSCSDLATLGQGKQVHAEIVKSGVSSITPVICALVCMYSRCGSLEDSENAFTEFPNFDSVLWNSMISAYGFHGHGRHAIELFERMKMENIEINGVTFLSLLYACSHCGLKEKGIEFFDIMVKKYGVMPSLEHYTCMVDLLGRLGCLEEAEAVIRTMEVEADVIIWKTLLSACKTHRNAEMARRVAFEVLRFDSEDASSLILLSNAHASANCWGHVSDVRKRMKEMNVKKEPGMSWVEVKNQVHSFSVGDRTHAMAREIESYLEELILELRLKKGYAPDTMSELHDMGIQEKEYNLRQHGEKKAVAFALIMAPESSAPIRVMKNLRICGDCHTTMKCVSDLKNREIIIRDSSRFHHFKRGACSCGDYW